MVKITDNTMIARLLKQRIFLTRVYQNIKQKMYNGKTYKSCRSLLNEIFSFMLLVEDNEGLMNEALDTLQELKDRLRQNKPQEQGFPLLKNENIKFANKKRQKGQNITLKSPSYRTENVNIFSENLLA